MKYFPTVSSAEREDGQIAVYLSSQSPNLPPVPLELQSFIMQEEWERRLIAINQLASRYSRLLLERIWVFVGFILSVLAPVIVFKVLEVVWLKNAWTDSGELLISRDKLVSTYTEIRLITFGVAVGVIIIVWGPFIAWKSIGRFRMRALVREWAQIDILAMKKGLFVPMWNVSLPSSYSSSTIVRVTIPARMNPTTFHPDAYLPPYINPPQYIAGYPQMGYNNGPFQDVKV